MKQNGWFFLSLHPLTNRCHDDAVVFYGLPQDEIHRFDDIVHGSGYLLHRSQYFKYSNPH